MVTPTKYIEAPAVAPAKFGLLDTVGVSTFSTPHEGFGIEWESVSCSPARLTLAACIYDTVTVDISVDDEGLAQLGVTGLPGSVGNGVIDWGDGTPLDDSGNWEHVYDDPGTYTVTLTDGLMHFSFTLPGVEVVDGEASGPFTGPATLIPDKVSDGLYELTQAEPFVVYSLSGCRLIASEGDEARAIKNLDLGATRAAEEFFIGMLAESGNVQDLTPTPGTAIGVVEAIALLEQRVAEYYGGVPVLHSTRDVATIAFSAGTVVRNGQTLETGLGTPFVAGAGYADADPTDPDGNPGPRESWVFVTGHVEVRQGAEVRTGIVPFIEEPDNEYAMLAERPMVIGYECYAAAVLVTTTVDSSGGGGGGGVDGGGP